MFLKLCTESFGSHGRIFPDTVTSGLLSSLIHLLLLYYKVDVSSLPQPFFLVEPAESGDRLTLKNHELRLHEINTLEWDELLAKNDVNSVLPKAGVLNYILLAGMPSS